MKKQITCCLVLVLAMLMAVTGLAEGAQTLSSKAPEVVTARGDADVRAEANGLSEIILTVPDGTSMTLLGVVEDWARVLVQDTVGYVHRTSVNGLPEVEQPEVPEMKVTIFSSRRSVMTPGESVTLSSLLEGFEGYEVTYQWQCDMGSGFADVPGATEATYTFAADIESLSWDWMLVVTAYPV